MKKRSRKNTQQAKALKVQRRWYLLFGAALVAVCYSGLQVVDAATETRALYQALGELQREEDHLLEESSRLSLERSSISNLQIVEEVAQEQLDMEFPTQVVATVTQEDTP